MNPELESFYNKILKLEKELQTLKNEFYKILQSQESQPTTPIENQFKDASTKLQPKLDLNKIGFKEKFNAITSHFQKNWEIILGGNWLAKSGLLIIIITTIWFLDFAFRRDWITDSTKIASGLLAGTFLIYISYAISKSKAKILSPSLVGAGFAILYVSIYSSYRFYSYFSNEETFLYLLILSMVLVLLSKWSMNQTVYCFGLLGIIFLPALFSTGEYGYKFLFSYLTIHMLIFLWASKNNDWKWASLLLFFCVWIVTGIWVFSDESKKAFLIPSSFILFSVGYFIYKEIIRDKSYQNTQLIWIPIVIIIGSLFSSSTSINHLIELHWAEGLGIGFLIISILSSYTAYYLSKKENSKNWIPFLFFSSVVLVFLALLKNIEKDWFTIGLLFFNLAYSYSSLLLKLKDKYGHYSQVFSYFLWAFLFLRLLVNETNDIPNSIPIFNQRFFYYFTTSLALSVLYFLFYRFKNQENPFYMVSSVVVLILGSLWEVMYGVQEDNLQNQGYSMVFVFYGLLFLGLGIRYKIKKIRIAGLVLFFILLAKFILYDIWLLELGFRILSGLLIGIILLGVGYYYEKIKEKIMV